MKAKRKVEIRIDRQTKTVFVAYTDRKPGQRYFAAQFHCDFEHEVLRSHPEQSSLLQAIESAKRFCKDNESKIEEPELSISVQNFLSLSK